MELRTADNDRHIAPRSQHDQQAETRRPRRANDERNLTRACPEGDTMTAERKPTARPRTMFTSFDSGMRWRDLEFHSALAKANHATGERLTRYHAKNN
jgi:hypothetical protein